MTTLTGQFESVEHARKTYALLQTEWQEAYRQKDNRPDEYAWICGEIERIKEQAVRQFAAPSASYPDMGCAACREYSVFGGPQHGNSSFCESGKRPHCSCEMCW